MTSGWQSIKTAPKDGTHILLRYRWAKETYVSEGWWNAHLRAWCCPSQPGVRAKEWMALPK